MIDDVKTFHTGHHTILLVVIGHIIHMIQRPLLTITGSLLLLRAKPRELMICVV